MQRLRELARLVEAVFDDLEQTFSNYQQQTGLTCLSGCGACCNNPKVEATPLELLPLALHYYDLGQAEQMLADLQQYSGFSCFHYKRHSLDGLAGQCSVYRQRPAICRMFGAASVGSKDGKGRLSVCKVIKQERPDAYESVIASDCTDAPRMSHGKSRIQQLDFRLGQQDMPINEALIVALEKVLFQSSFSDTESTGLVA